METRRKDILDKTLEELDDHCSFILAGIIYHSEEGIGFNQLYREIREKRNYSNIAKTTLCIHLKHLLDTNFITKDIEEDSRLKLKPTTYRTSPYFKELSKGFVAQSITPEDFLPLMMSEDVKSVTNHLMNTIILHVSECLASVLQAPENISRLNMFQLFYNMETLMRAYRERILEKNKRQPFRGWRKKSTNLSIQ